MVFCRGPQGPARNRRVGDQGRGGRGATERSAPILQSPKLRALGCTGALEVAGVRIEIGCCFGAVTGGVVLEVGRERVFRMIVNGRSVSLGGDRGVPEKTI